MVISRTAAGRRDALLSLILVSLVSMLCLSKRRVVDPHIHSIQREEKNSPSVRILVSYEGSAVAGRKRPPGPRARGRRKSPRGLQGLGSAAFSPFYCDKNPDGERPAFWETGFKRRNPNRAAALHCRPYC